MAPLRERREWRDAAENMVGGVSKRSLVGIRAEQKAPFRLFRIILSSGLGAGALLGLFIILSRLVSALQGGLFSCVLVSPPPRGGGTLCNAGVDGRTFPYHINTKQSGREESWPSMTNTALHAQVSQRCIAGGEGAPDLTDTLKNLAINGAAVGVLGFIFQRDLKGQQSDKKVIEREEALARLQVPPPPFGIAHLVMLPSHTPVKEKVICHVPSPHRKGCMQGDITPRGPLLSCCTGSGLPCVLYTMHLHAK